MLYSNQKIFWFKLPSKGSRNEWRGEDLAQKHKIILTHRLFCYYCSIL